MFNGATAMAYLHAANGVDLCHCDAIFRQKKERVVAEARGASRSNEDYSIEAAVCGAEDFAVTRKSKRAMIAGLAAGFGDAVEGAEERGVVSLVERRGRRMREVLVLGITGAADAGCAFQAGDLEAGVVGNNELPGSVAGIVDGLGPGVRLKGGFIFGRRGNLGQAGQRLDSEGAAVTVRGIGEVAEFAGIGCGGVEEHADEIVCVDDTGARPCEYGA